MCLKTLGLVLGNGGGRLNVPQRKQPPQLQPQPLHYRPTLVLRVLHVLQALQHTFKHQHPHPHRCLPWHSGNGNWKMYGARFQTGFGTRGMSLCHYVTCHYVTMSLCHYVTMSLCHWVSHLLDRSPAYVRANRMPLGCSLSYRLTLHCT
jgi:hypothetical protein